MQKITAEDAESKSSDIVSDNIVALNDLFPDAFIEGKVDFEVLKQLLGGVVEERDEKYGLNWHGKRAARQLGLTPSARTLRPCPGESVDWDTSRNLLIEGENLEVLKLLQKTYAGKIKLIYIDPPYNTGGDFVYTDSYTDPLHGYHAMTGQIDDAGTYTTSEVESSGRFHSKWLSMMYPRLRLARALLSERGVLLVHIDEHEQSHLHEMLAELFGEENHLGTWVWDKRNPKGDARGIAYQHESIVLYARDALALLADEPLRRPKKNAERMLAAAERFVRKTESMAQAAEKFRAWVKAQDGLSGGEKMYNRLTRDGRPYRLVSMAWPNKKTAPDAYFIPLAHPISGNVCPVPERGWRNPPETMKRLLSEGLIEFGADASTQPQRRYFLDENMMESIPSILPFGGSDDALFSKWKLKFDNPKPVAFVADLIQWLSADEDIVLDFFAGSATVGHATWIANERTGASRRFILVQVRQESPSSGTETIVDTAKARLRLAGDDLAPSSACGSSGFRVFKLDHSNIQTWDPGRDDLLGSLSRAVDNVREDRSEQDILFEILLKLGTDLTVSIETRQIASRSVYSVASGTMLACLAASIAQKDIEAIGLGIVAWHEELNPAGESIVVFRDSAFANDVTKLNLTGILEQHGLTAVRSL